VIFDRVVSPPGKLRPHHRPFIPQLVVQLEETQLVMPGPILLRVGGVDVRDIPVLVVAYLSLHCLPLRPLTPSSCSRRAMWLHLLSPLLSYTQRKRRSYY
jgi:hypothetical protein